jgi:cytochrome c biogenesis protein
MFKGYAFLILSSVFFIGVVIAGLFHLKQVGIYYFALLFASGFLFAVSFLKFLWDSLRSLYRDYKKFNSLPVFLFEFFASLKLAIFLMIAIGILSMLGSTYIEQNRPFEFYVNKYGPDEGRVVLEAVAKRCFPLMVLHPVCCPACPKPDPLLLQETA